MLKQITIILAIALTHEPLMAFGFGGGGSVVIVGNTDPLELVQRLSIMTSAASTVANTMKQLTVMGNPGAAASLVGNLDMSGASSASLKLTAGDLLTAGVNFNGQVATIDLSGVRTDVVFNALGIDGSIQGVVGNNGQVSARVGSTYSQSVARHQIYASAEAKRATNRTAMDEVAEELAAARTRLQSSTDESSQRVIAAEIASLSATYAQLKANEDAIIASRDSSIAMMENAERIRGLAVAEDQAAVSRSRDEAARKVALDRQANALKTSIDKRNTPQPQQPLDWTATIMN